MNLLNRCNQACPMCGVHAGEDRALSVEAIARAARALRAVGVQVVEISGGEPFLHPELPEIVRRLDAERLLFTFNTNGTALTDAGLEALRAARGLLQVAVSLDSLDRERYRLLRGRDLLGRALEGLDRLRDARLPCPLKLNQAVSRHNADETPALLALAERRGLFLSVFPVNQGPGAHRSACRLFEATPAERAALAARFEALAVLRRRGAPLWEPSRFYETAAAFLRGEPLGPCGAGRLYLDVRADGGIAPCVELPAVATLDELAAGRAGGALRAAEGSVAACRATSPCCYTCTVSLAEIGRRPLAYAAETARVLWRARRRGREAGA